MTKSKRILDLILCAISAPIILPLLLCLAIWIKIDSRGTVFFVQPRVGRHKSTFVLYKLRTMFERPVFSQVEEPILSAADDRRITTAGRILRASSLDELPQIWNVVRGEMSFVGPRPLLPEQLRAVPDENRIRFDVVPGITGLAQVSGRRSLSWPDQLKWDCAYVASRNLSLDLKILLKTIKVVFTRKDVYAGQTPNWRNYIMADKMEDSHDANETSGTQDETTRD